jgi:hypothetical protein
VIDVRVGNFTCDHFVKCNRDHTIYVITIRVSPCPKKVYSNGSIRSKFKMEDQGAACLYSPYKIQTVGALRNGVSRMSGLELALDSVC